MSSVVELLLELANPNRTLQATRMAELASSLTRGERDLFEGLLRVHRVEGLVANRLDELPGEVLPGDLADRLRKKFHRNKLQAMKMVGEFRRIHRRLGEAGIAVMPIKGVDLVQRVYTDPGLRPFEDMDLVVREGDVTAATDVLQGLGYELPKSLLPAAVVKKFHFHLPFFHTTSGILVELHWRLADRQSLSVSTEETVWAGAQRADEPYPVLAPALYACYLAVHMAKHGYLNARIARHDRVRELALHPWADLRLMWFVDLALLMQKFGTSVEDIRAVARSCRCVAAVEDVLSIGAALLGTSGPVASSTATTVGDGVLERRVKDRLVKGMLRDMDGRGVLDFRTPWMLAINKHTHIRPVRLLRLGRPG